MAERDRRVDPSMELEIDTSSMRSRFEPPPEPDMRLELERPVAPPPVQEAPSLEPPDLSNPALVRPPPPDPRAPRRAARTFDRAPVATFELSTRARIAIAAAAALLVAAGLFYGLGSREGPSAVDEAEASGRQYRVTDQVLADAFGRDAAGATRTYAGHRVYIVGRFAKLRLDFGGANALQLVGNGAWLIDAVLRPEVWKSLATPSGGQRVVVDCVVRGSNGEYVRADDCTLAD